ncbi:MAG: helix-turn-helix transcriptional regulator, partial [Peptostreptococcaceae bacterium]
MSNISKIGNALKMMFLIQSKGRVKCSELSEILEVSERQIQKYKQDLEQSGIFINSKAGIYGGYELDKSNMISNVSLTDKEVCVLEMINE